MNQFILGGIVVFLTFVGFFHSSWALEFSGTHPPQSTQSGLLSSSAPTENLLPSEHRIYPERTQEFQEHVIEMLKRFTELSRVRHPEKREHRNDYQRTISQLLKMNHPFDFLKDRIGPWFEKSIAACKDTQCLDDTQAEISEILEFWKKLIQPSKKKLDPAKFSRVREALRGLEIDPKFDENFREGVRTLVSALNGELSFREWIARITADNHLRIKTKNKLKALLISYQHYMYRATLSRQAEIHGLTVPAPKLQMYNKTLLPCRQLAQSSKVTDILHVSFGIGGVVSLGHLLCEDKAGIQYDVFISGVGVGASGSFTIPVVSIAIWSPFGKNIDPSGVWLGSASEVAALWAWKMGVYVGKYGSILVMNEGTLGFGGNTTASMVYIRRRN